MKVLLSQNEIDQGVTQLAQQIHDTYGQQPLTIIGVMTGSIVLLADVIRLLEMPLRVGVVQASSYKGKTERGELTINADLMPDITNRDVLLVDDIFDTGHTLSNVVSRMQQLNPKSVRSAVLLHKNDRQEVDFQPDFVVFKIPDEFVVGYGLDYQDAYRNLPYIGVLEDSDLSQHSQTT